MTRAGDMMVARRENVRQSFAFRAEGGDDDTMRWNWVEVVEPPQLESLSITSTRRPTRGCRPHAAERHLEVLAGTGIEIERHGQQAARRGQHSCSTACQPIAATIAADAAGNDRRAFHIAPDQWIAAKSGPYRLELADDDGVAGVVGQWNLARRTRFAAERFLAAARATICTSLPPRSCRSKSSSRTIWRSRGRTACTERRTGRNRSGR